MRAQLVNEIKLQGKLGSSATVAATLEGRALDSLVLSHLRSMRYEYASSVFVPEAGLAENAMSDADACRVFRLPASALAHTGGAPRSALLRLLSAAAELRPAVCIESGTQTEAADGTAVELMLQQVDRRVASQLERGDGAPPALALEDHMLKFQRDADERAAAKLQADVARLREVEVHKIRAEERAACVAAPI